jgi:phosphate transport system substrate-binding protein
MTFTNFIRVVAFAVGAATVTIGHAADISGAGATFPFPIYAKWADSYKKDTGNGPNYQSIGSGAGIKQIKARTVTFGATDAPLEPAELEKAGLAQWPMVMGGIVAVVNLDGVKPGDIVIDGPTLAQIYLGKITKWNDPALKALNPKLDLPNLPIVPIHRADGSGTTFNFTYYLGEVSPDWSRKSACRRRLIGRAASAPRAMTASPTTSPRPRARSAMSNSLTLIRTS